MLKKNKNTKKLKLGFYPYTYVRTNVMRTLLINKEEYQKLLKMSLNEITRYLQDSNYKNEINNLSTELKGPELLEIALNKNIKSSFEKLRRISPPELNILINKYLKRKDVEDVKTIMRGKYTNTNKKVILNSLQGAGTYSLDFFNKLLEYDDLIEVLKHSNLFDFLNFSNPIKDFEEKNSLVSIENKMDSLYFKEMLDFTKFLPVQGQLFKNFLHQEIEVRNLLTLVRLKNEKLDRNEIKNYLIFSGENEIDSKLIKLLDTDLDNLMESLEKKDYSKILKNGLNNLKEKNSLIDLEINFFKYLLEKSILMLHQNPLSIDVILGYMFAKEIEVRNLKILIKGKQLNLKEEFIENQLVY